MRTGASLSSFLWDSQSLGCCLVDLKKSVRKVKDYDNTTLYKKSKYINIIYELELQPFKNVHGREKDIKMLRVY